MSDSGVDLSRRRFLTTTTTVVGGVGMAGAAWMFIDYMNKSERTLSMGAPVRVDISKLQLGQLMVVNWRNMPVWVLRRTPDMLKELGSQDAQLRDPASAVEQQPSNIKGPHRSIKPEYLVVIGLCTHLGCQPKRINKDMTHDLGANWLGGFFCACHGSKFDFAGRVYSGVPAPTNLKVPPHRYLDADGLSLIIGEDTGVTHV